MKRAHVKSRSGCLECRRRRIRCDETRPECLNCRRRRCHGAKIACRFEVIKPPTTFIVTSDAQFQQTARLIESLPIDIPGSLDELPDLKGHSRLLFSHIAANNLAVANGKAHKLAFGATLVPEYLRIAQKHDYMRDCICAYGALHLSKLTGRTQALAFAETYFKIRTLASLRATLSDFLPEKVESCLATSLLLSWIASDKTEYTTAIRGVQTMLKELEKFPQDSRIRQRLSPGSGKRVQLPTGEGAFDLQYWLQPALNSLQNLEKRLSNDKDVLPGVRELRYHMINVRSQTLGQANDMSLQGHYRMHNWLLWVPKGPWLMESESVPMMLFLAHYEMGAVISVGLLSQLQDPLALYRRSQVIETIHTTALEQCNKKQKSLSLTKNEIEELLRIPLQVSQCYRNFYEAALAEMNIIDSPPSLKE